MKRLIFFVLLLATLGACTPPPTEPLTDLTKVQVLQIVSEGTEKGKNYIITPKANGLFDVKEVNRFPEQ